MEGIEHPPGTGPPWRAYGGLPLAAGLLGLAIAATVLAVRLGDEGDTADVLTRAQEAARSIGTFRFKMTQSIPGGGAATPFSTVTMDGAADLKAERSRFVLVTKGSRFSLRCEMIADGEELYIHVDPRRRAQIAAEWVRSDTPTMLAGGTFQFRPDRLYRDARGIFEDLKRKDTKELRGVQTTRYAGTLDFASFLPAPVNSPRPTTGFDLDLPVEVFVDERGLIHRMALTVSAPRAPSTAFKVTVDFFDYGDPIDISLPASDAVKDGTPQESATACFPTR